MGALRCALLALSLDAVWVAGFRQGLGSSGGESKREGAGGNYVPSVVVRVPDGQTRPAISNRPAPGLTDGLRVWAGGRGARPPTIPRTQTPLLGDGYVQAVSAPARVHVKAQAVINQWAKTVAQQSLETDDDDKMEVIWDTLHALGEMREDIEAGSRNYVFALRAGEDVKALATVSSEEREDEFHGKRMELHIGELLIRPALEDPTVAPAFIRKITGWAVANGHAIPTATKGKIDEYYRSLGLDPDDEFWPSTLLGGYTFASGAELELVTLDL